MAHLYADENFRQEVVDLLRSFGHDILTVREAGKQGGIDAQVLADASATGRAVLTFNRRDFIRLHSRTAVHAGIIVCTDDDPAKLAGRIHQALTTYPSLANQLLRINRLP